MCFTRYLKLISKISWKYLLFSTYLLLNLPIANIWTFDRNSEISIVSSKTFNIFIPLNSTVSYSFWISISTTFASFAKHSIYHSHLRYGHVHELKVRNIKKLFSIPNRSWDDPHRSEDDWVFSFVLSYRSWYVGEKGDGRTASEDGWSCLCIVWVCW